MEQQKQRLLKHVLIGTAVAGLLYVHFGTTLLPLTHRARAAEIGQLEQRHDQIRLQVDRAHRLVGGLPRLEAAYAGMLAQWDLAQRLLPERTEIAALLREISFRGQESGVDFTLFKPGPLTAHDFFSEKSVEIRIEGGYHQIARCLNQLARMDRIVHVRDLEVEEIQGNEREKEGPTARAHFFVSAYVLGGAPVNAEPAAAEKGGLGGAVKRLVAGRQESPAAPRVAGRTEGGSEE
ncbi:MAG: type 4a pilus biogenesis protein PilO [Candidatus Eisenbacteria bacterium]